MDKFNGKQSKGASVECSNGYDRQCNVSNQVYKSVSSENNPKSTITFGITKMFTVTQSSVAKRSLPIPISQKHDQHNSRCRTLAYEEDQKDRRRCRSGTSSPHQSSSARGSPSRGSPSRASPTSLKIKGSLLLHHVLHPVDFYNERKSRSRHSSISSDQGGESGNTAKEIVKTRHSSDSNTKNTRHSNTPSPTNVWVYKPQARQRLNFMASKIQAHGMSVSPYSTYTHSGYSHAERRSSFNPDDYRSSRKPFSSCDSRSISSSSSSGSSSCSDSETGSSDESGSDGDDDAFIETRFSSKPACGHHKRVVTLRQESAESENDSVRSSGYMSDVEGSSLKRVIREHSLPCERASSTERLYSTYDQIVQDG